MDQHQPHPPEPAAPGAAHGAGPPSFFERASTARALFRALAVACALLAGADLLVHDHAHFSYETWFAFSGLFGFVAYMTIVHAAKLLRLAVKRPEDYYDR